MAIAHVQSRGTSGTGTSLGLAFSSNTAAGSLLIAAVCANVDPTVPTDSQGNSWVSVRPSTVINVSNFVAMFFSRNCPGGADTVTVTFGSSQSIILMIAEYSGMDVVTPLDASGSGSGFGTALSTGNVNTVLADELLITAAVSENTAGDPFTAGTNFTERVEVNRGSPSPASGQLQERIVSSAGAYAGAATLGSSTNWAQQVAAFKIYTTPQFKPDYRQFPKAALRYPKVFQRELINSQLR